jgi:hypothetical protein
MAMQIVRVHRGVISRTRREATRFEDPCVSLTNFLTDKILYVPKILLLIPFLSVLLYRIIHGLKF